MNLNDLVLYTGWSCLIAGPIYLCNKIIKIKKELKKKCERRIRNDLTHDLNFLSSMPTEPYVALNDSQQDMLEGFNDYIKYLRKKYSQNTPFDILKGVQNGPNKNELRAKQKRIEKLLSQIPSIEQGDGL